MELPARFPVLVQYRELGIPGEKVVDAEMFVESLLQVWVHRAGRGASAAHGEPTPGEGELPWDLEHPEVREALIRAVAKGQSPHLFQIVHITECWRRSA